MTTESDCKIPQVDSPLSEDIYKDDDDEVWDKDDPEKDVEVAEGVEVDSPGEDVSDEDDSSDGLEKPLKGDDGKLVEAADPSDFPMRAMTIDLPFNGGELYFNHATSLIGIGLLWGLAIWCMVDPEGSRAELIRWRQQSALFFTWFYIGTRPLFTFFILFIAFRYGDVRLGPPDSKPEFTNGTYFAMLFAAGVAVGLFFYGVSEPLWHQSSHWYANAGYHTQDEIDMFAINQTLFHWGLAAWCGYVVVGLACGLAAYRFGLPLTFRSGLYTVFRDYTWGWIGDLCDGVTIVVTVAGVCTSLGLGAMQITQGLIRIGWVTNTSEDWLTNVQIIVIWVITCIATASVLSGLSIGIKYLSNIAFFFGIFLLFAVFVLDRTSYQLNLMVQSIGYYFQYNMFLVNFWTDAFGQLREGEGRAIDESAAASWWMDAWTVFYMAWWTSWAGFVGLFIARISKGRTVRNVVLYSLFCPLMYSFIWFAVFGGVGLRQARQALELQKAGEDWFGDPTFYEADTPNCFNVPQENIDINGTTVFTNHVPGVTPVCYFNASDADNAWFNVMYSFSYPQDFGSGGFGPFLAVVSIIAIAIYFITSSDSGSLIVDHLASNGHEEHHWLQRLFWAFTEGAVASALLVAGGSQSLQALQAASIVAGLPFTILMLYMVSAIYTMCDMAEKGEYILKQEVNEFATPVYGGIFNIFEWLFSFGYVNPERIEKGMDRPTMAQAKGFFINLLLPSLALRRIVAAMYPRDCNKKSNMLTVITYTVLYLAWVALFVSVIKSYGMRVFGWTCFFSCGLILMSIKSEFRERYNLSGNAVGDFISSVFAYPCVLWQLEEQCGLLGLPQEREE